jgi:threonine synthase
MNTNMPAEAGVTHAPDATIGVPYLRCIGCDADVTAPTEDFACPACGDRLEVAYRRHGAPDVNVLKTLWCARKISAAPTDLSGVWRFREALPILPAGFAPVTLREGNTPIYPLARCARAASVDALFAKHQGMNPTGSFKDTGMTTALSMARVGGFRWVGCASTGNTSASMAAYAAHAGMRALVLIPEGKIAWGKLSQSLDYAAFTCQLKTDFDGCVRVLGEVIRRFPLYLLNSVNPYRLEGQKTTAYEMMEQLGWEPPDHVIMPGGNLGNSSALGKGFREMLAMGLIRRLPRLSIIQARGANPLVRCVKEFAGERLEPVRAETRATAIRIGNPASWKKAVAVLRETGGACEDVSEEEIGVAKAEIGADGVGCEPASAVTLAGLKNLVRSGFVKRGESVVLVLTGHCLKDPEYTMDFHRDAAAGDQSLRKPPVLLDADPAAVIGLLNRMEM